MKDIEVLLNKNELTQQDIVEILSLDNQEDLSILQQKAYNLTTEVIGNKVYYRGIVEFSNICALDCFYCGIRRGNKEVDRYILTEEEIIESCLWCEKMGYGSCVLQAGERQDRKFVDFVEKCIREIKEQSKSEKLPDGLGITLSVGVQSPEVLKRFFDAGAHRYLLRLETTSENLFREIHPRNQSIEERVRCLENLREIGFQVGTGVMLGLPGQKLEDIADDILFIKKLDVDMIGLGPYIPHKDTPMFKKGMMEKDALLQLSLNTIAILRILMKDVNIAATTALQALEFRGREKGIEYGANVIMPNLTPVNVREKYKLYDGKPCTDEAKEDCLRCLQMRVELAKREVGWNDWGDSLHFKNRKRI